MVVKEKVKVKARIGLDLKGIAKLEKVMLANGKYFYNQSVYGDIIIRAFDEAGHRVSKNECKTELCGAGFCRLLTVGPERLKKELSNRTAWKRFGDKCIADGVTLLGIREEDTSSPCIPCIFESTDAWPLDLEERFIELHKKPMAQVRFYIRMLKTRANSDGTLTEKGERRF